MKNTFYMYFLLALVQLFYCTSFLPFSRRLKTQYKQHYLKDKFIPVFEEKTINVKHNVTLFSKIRNQVFAQIGSNPKYANDADYHWFDGDGMIHAIYFNNSEVIYQNKWIQTKRLQTEEKWKKKLYLYFGELKGVHGMVEIMKFSLMQLFGFIPNYGKGTANTALLNWNNKIYALHEGDMPYELEINNKEFNISTKQRLFYPSIYSTTAHPIIDNRMKRIYMYGYNNYDFLQGKFIFNAFDQNMELLKQQNISLINNGMTHDVGFVNKFMIIPDMPLKYDVNRILKEQLPIYFDKENGVTRFGIFDVIDNKKPDWFYFKENFFIFHFSNVYKNLKGFDIFACVMDDLHMEDFVEVDNLNNENHIIRGELRLKKIEINTKKNTTKIIENKYLQNLNVSFPYNLDFPITSIKNKDEVYCTIFDSSKGYICGYIKINLKNFEYSKPKIFLFKDNEYGNSEPQPIIIKDKEYLITFTNNKNDSFISLINMEKKKSYKIKIPTRIPPGFHSSIFNLY